MSSSPIPTRETQDGPHGPSREAVLEQLFDLFRHSGFEGVSISDISAATGLGKSSLYHHFPGGKSGMARAVLDRARTWFRDEVLSPLESAEASRERRVDAMLTALDGLYCAGAKPCILASMLLGGSGGIRGTVSEAFGQWRQSLTQALSDTGSTPDQARERATLAIIQIEGALIVSRALGDQSIFRDALKSVRALLLS